MITETNLRPCPFCGGESYFQHAYDIYNCTADPLWCIMCKECNTQTKLFPCRLEAIKEFPEFAPNDSINITLGDKNFIHIRNYMCYSHLTFDEFKTFTKACQKIVEWLEEQGNEDT